MAKISHPRELVVAQLARLLYVEEQLVNSILPELKQTIDDGDLKGGVTLHLSQTHDHVVNLHKAFELLDEEPKPEKEPALEGLRESHEQTVKQVEGPKLLDVVHATAIVQTERLEISSYEAVLALVRNMHLKNDLAHLLEQNLSDERAALDLASKTLGQLTTRAAAG